jgi:hypothetical protein
MGLIKFFGLEEKGEVLEKVYCQECKHLNFGKGRCNRNPKKEVGEGTWYYRPQLTDSLKFCELKNQNNDCKDFEKK